jgi:ligand-binding SRPBCC domain-containing protein
VNKLNHIRTLCIWLDYIYTTRWYTVRTTSSLRQLFSADLSKILQVSRICSLFLWKPFGIKHRSQCASFLTCHAMQMRFEGTDWSLKHRFLVECGVTILRSTASYVGGTGLKKSTQNSMSCVSASVFVSFAP